MLMPSGWSGVNTRSSGTGRIHGNIITETVRRSCRRGERRGFWGFTGRRLQWPDLEGIFPSGGVSWEGLRLFGSVRPVRWRRPAGSVLKGR